MKKLNRETAQEERETKTGKTTFCRTDEDRAFPHYFSTLNTEYIPVARMPFRSLSTKTSPAGLKGEY